MRCTVFSTKPSAVISVTFLFANAVGALTAVCVYRTETKGLNDANWCGRGTSERLTQWHPIQ